MAEKYSFPAEDVSQGRGLWNALQVVRGIPLVLVMPQEDVQTLDSFTMHGEIQSLVLGPVDRQFHTSAIMAISLLGLLPQTVN